jgi:phosphatidylserine/phosphatidylglycerophosphate/cardiolipin synthase-like enzyme
LVRLACIALRAADPRSEHKTQEIAMSIKLAVIANGDDVALAWKPVKPIPRCFGFAIERRRNGGEIEVLNNRVSTKPSKKPVKESSRDSPFKRIHWTDHAVNVGDTVQYRIVSMLGAPGEFTEGPMSSWSKSIKLTHQCGSSSVFFNRGIVLSQFVSRIMEEKQWTPGDIKKNAKIVEGQFRRFLSGDLRVALVNILEAAAKNLNIEVYAALFELTDEELISRLVDLGPRLHIVLANGAIDVKGEDENESARAALVAAGANVYDRFSAPTFLGHNKYLVIVEKGRPKRILTGSANWMPTGMCTQINNGILIEDPKFAQLFLDAWIVLRDAGDKKGTELLDANSVDPLPSVKLKDGSIASVRFTAVRGEIDLRELEYLIGQAKESILFQMFMPGYKIFQAVASRKEDIFVRGVANTFPKPPKNPKAGEIVTEVDLLDGKQADSFKLQVIEPEGVRYPIANWAQEVTRKDFRAAIGHSIIHSKVLVIDAMGKNPIVVTGSHNFSKSASNANDENFVVVRGNRELARAYAVNCLSVYDHYRFRQYLLQSFERELKPWSYNNDGSADWLANYLKSPSRKALLDFFGL